MFPALKRAICRYICDHVFAENENFKVDEAAPAPTPPPQEPGFTPNHVGILLPYGSHKIAFAVDYQPREVYVAVEPVGLQACGTDSRNMVGVSLGVDQFTIAADIVSDSATVKWMLIP